MMRLRSLLTALPLALAGCSGAPEAPPNTPPPSASSSAEIAPPVAHKRPHTVALATGEKVEDPYFWLREKDTPDVQTHLLGESTYADAMLAPLAPLRDALLKEMRGRVVEDDAEVPAQEGAYLYYKRMAAGKQHEILARKAVKDGASAKEEVMLDLNEIAKTERFVGVGARDVSDDGNLFAYGLDTVGFRQLTLHVKDLRTGKELSDKAERVTSIAWARDNQTLFYTVEDPVSKRSHRLYRHKLGAPASGDALVYEEKDERFSVFAERSRSRAFIFVTSMSKMTSEVRLMRADKPEEAPVVVEPRAQGHEYYVDHRGDDLLITTNSARDPSGPKSPNFRLVSAPVSDPGRARWKEIIEHKSDTMLEDIWVFSDFAVVREIAGGVRTLRVFPGKTMDQTTSFPVAMNEAVYSLQSAPNLEMSAKTFRFKYESPTTPEVVMEFDPKDKSLRELKRTVVPGLDRARYETKRIVARAGDGTPIPISLVYRKGTQPNGQNPALLYGYGSYGRPIFLGFNSPLVSLLDRGVVYAVAHVRGGGELGKPWHEAGRMKQKRNTFTDFVACAEALAKERWADPKRIVIQGKSAGGLLVGATVNLRPDLFAGVLAEVPFVDVVNTMLDTSLPLTVGEFEEWGDPRRPDELAYIRSYSPYDNVAAKAYPPMLVRTAYHDSQVMYWEPAKWVAKLRATKTDKNPIVLRIQMGGAGHGGRAGRYDKLADTAESYAWILTRLGLGG